MLQEDVPGKEKFKNDRLLNALLFFCGFLYRCFQIFPFREDGTDSLFENRQISPDRFKHCFVIHTEVVVH